MGRKNGVCLLLKHKEYVKMNLHNHSIFQMLSISYSNETFHHFNNLGTVNCEAFGKCWTHLFFLNPLLINKFLKTYMVMDVYALYPVRITG